MFQKELKATNHALQLIYNFFMKRTHQIINDTNFTGLTWSWVGVAFSTVVKVKNMYDFYWPYCYSGLLVLFFVSFALLFVHSFKQLLRLKQTS